MPRVKIYEDIQVRSNLSLTMRERGKIVTKREGHNIWLNLGREYLASLICATSWGPLTFERNDRIRYMGMGIGGTAQLATSTANSPPLGGGVPENDYAGTNSQTDIDPTVTKLERPVRVSGGHNPYPGDVSDLWLGQVQAPAIHPTATQTTFIRLFSETDISYDPYLVVPLSEVMLFTDAANPNVYNNTGVAYDSFNTLSKTVAFSLEVNWTIRF